jgi:hypothetical protein
MARHQYVGQNYNIKTDNKFFEVVTKIKVFWNGSNKSIIFAKKLENIKLKECLLNSVQNLLPSRCLSKENKDKTIIRG